MPWKATDKRDIKNTIWNKSYFGTVETLATTKTANTIDAAPLSPAHETNKH